MRRGGTLPSVFPTGVHNSKAIGDGGCAGAALCRPCSPPVRITTSGVGKRADLA